jgi:hypothetical protein
MNENVKYDRARKNAYNNVPKIPDARIPPQPLVELERKKRQGSNCDKPGKHLQEIRHCFPGNLPIKSDPKSEIVGEYDQ